MKLEYLILFEKSGIPIYSHCFGGFCAHLGMDETLLSGFLSALSSMPQLFGQKGGVQSVEMDYTKLMFSGTETGKVMVVGVDKTTYKPEKSDGTISELFSKTQKLLDEEYGDVDWRDPGVRRNAFNHELVDVVVRSTLGVFENYCRQGDNCMLASSIPKDDNETTLQTSIWEKLQMRYSKIMGSMPSIKKVMVKPMMRIMNWMDKRDYNKKAEASSTA